MRLWHKDLIPYLPRKQLIAQWRECCAIAGSIAKKGTPNHLLVNKIMNYPSVHFMEYTRLIVGNTWYTGSEYPLSSMIRLVKYAKRDCFLGNSHKVSQIEILNDIVKRGFIDYKDFKDQMDAIDMLVLEEDEANVASELFKTFQDRGLVDK